MNDRASRLVAAITNAPNALRALLSDWDNVDNDTREHYLDDARWLLASARVFVDSQDLAECTPEQLLEIDRATAELAAFCGGTGKSR
jgi:hypothetical protein